MKRTEIDLFLQGNCPILDVRSPAEFAAGHIPGALSFPLFSNEERAEVGTIYKTTGKKEAVKKGLELVGPKMKSFIERAELMDASSFHLYCWRGGMRSESMAWLLEKYGLEMTVLEGGYKAFRQGITHFFDQALPLKVLTGFTGSGKTEVLQELQKQNIQVIDLEKLARHQGSSFGNQLSHGQPTTEMFQNELFIYFHALDLSKDIWIEDESFCIGGVHLPEKLFKQMTESPQYLLEIDTEKRVDRLVQDYGELEPTQLIQATRDIQKKLGELQSREAIKLITNRDLRGAASIILEYYDRQYRKSIRKKTKQLAGTIRAGAKCSKEIAKQIMEEYVSKTHVI